MTAITHTGFTATSRADKILAAVAGFFTDFWAGARDGNDIHTRYHALSQLSAADLNRYELARTEVTRAALTGWPH
jgi:hypothetical protein